MQFSTSKQEKEQPVRPDRKDILTTYRVLRQDSGIAELRVPQASTREYRKSHTESGFFNDAEKFADAAIALDGVPGIYITINRPDPALFARSANRVKIADRGGTTSDTNIIRRTNMAIDFDPARPAGISSTDQEHDAALVRARAAKDWLSSDLGFPEPLYADSSNGAHLIYAIDEPAEDNALVETCLKALNEKFGDSVVGVDQTMFNPSRISKVYGTISRKGDNVPDRPHRLSRIISCPDKLEVVPTTKLQLLASLATKATPATRTTNPTRRDGAKFSIDTFIAKHIPDAIGPEPWAGNSGMGRRWEIPVCPWNTEHANREACIVELPSGALQAGCRHNSCKGKDWEALRELFEPGYLANRTEKHEGQWKYSAAQSAAVGVESVVQNSAQQNSLGAVATDGFRNQPKHPPKPDSTRAEIICMGDVRPEDIEYVESRLRLARGKLCLLAGPPGGGKSLLSMHLSAMLSKGLGLFGETIGEPCDVLMLLAEDGLADTVKIRLAAAGADDTRIFALTAVTTVIEGTKEKKSFDLAKDISALREAIKSLRRCRLVIIDTVNSYMGGKVNSDKDTEVRAILLPLVELAEEMGVAVLAISHLNKGGQGGSAVNRVMGSLAFVGVSRVAWMLAADAADKDRCIVAPVKCNLGRRPQAMAFKIIDGPRVAWETEGLDITADDMLAAQEEAKGDGQNDGVREWLIEALKDGPKPANDMNEEKANRHYSNRAVDKVCDELGVRKGRPKNRYGGPWYWGMPPYIDDGKIVFSPVLSHSPLSDPNRESTRNSGEIPENTLPSGEVGTSTPKTVLAHSHSLGRWRKSTSPTESSAYVEDEV